MQKKSVRKARNFFEKPEKRKKSYDVREIVDRVRKSGSDINQEALRRFRIQQRLDEIREKEAKMIV